MACESARYVLLVDVMNHLPLIISKNLRPVSGWDEIKVRHAFPNQLNIKRLAVGNRKKKKKGVENLDGRDD